MPSSHYIVTFKKDTPDDVIESHIAQTKASGGIIKHRYNSAIKGYSVEVPDDVVGTMSLKHDSIDFVEADGEVTTQGKALLT